MAPTLIECAEIQDEIICLQSSIIDRLFRDLCQTMGPDELASMPILDSLDEVARKRARLGG